RNLTRSEMSTIAGHIPVRLIYEAKDGFICWRVTLGLGSAGARMDKVIEWMIAETGIGVELRDVPWSRISTLEVKLSDIEAWEAVFAQFFKTKTRAELLEEARAREILLLPVLAPEDVIRDRHVRERNTFVKVSHAGQTFSVPAFPVRAAGVHQGRLAPRTL